MVGRPRHEATPEQRAEIERLARKMGRGGIVARTGLPARLIQRELESLRLRTRRRLEFEPREDAYLRSYAHAKGLEELQRDLAALAGVVHPLERIRVRVQVLMTLGMRELRTELSVEQVAILIGRDEKHVRNEIERKRLRAHRMGGTIYRVAPSDLRLYVLADKARVDYVRFERDELMDLIAKLWGVSDDNERAQRRKARGGTP